MTRTRSKYTLIIMCIVLIINSSLAVYFAGNELKRNQEFSLEEFFIDNYFTFGFLLPWLLFVAVILILYLRITCLIFQTVEQRTFGRNVTYRDSFALYQVSLSTEYHVTLAKVVGLVVAIYFLANVPTLLQYIIPFSSDNMEVVTLVCLTISFTSSVCPPFIYGWTVTEFTAALTHIFGMKSAHEVEKLERPVSMANILPTISRPGSMATILPTISRPDSMATILPTISTLTTPDYHDYMEIPNIDTEKQFKCYPSTL